MTLGRFLSQTLRILVLAAIVLFASHGLASAQSRSSRFGLGGMVGEPTGLSMKLRLSPAFAIDFGVWLGVRGAVGLVWEFTQRHLDVFVEAAPTLWLLQGVYFDVGGAVGARYWF